MGRGLWWRLCRSFYKTILTALRSSIPIGHERGALDVQPMRRDSPDLEILCRMAARGRSLMRYGNCISISIIPGTRRQKPATGALLNKLSGVVVKFLRSFLMVRNPAGHEGMETAGMTCFQKMVQLVHHHRLDACLRLSDEVQGKGKFSGSYIAAAPSAL